jgi:hypothetical protein
MREMQPARRSTMRLVVISIALVVATACSSSDPNPPVNHLNAREVIDALGLTDLRCTGKPVQFSGGATAVCEPLASVLHAALSVAVYADAASAEAQFKANCSDKIWNLYRTGENWRGAISTAANATFPRAKAIAVANALHTTAHLGCGPA